MVSSCHSVEKWYKSETIIKKKLINAAELTLTNKTQLTQANNYNNYNGKFNVTYTCQ